uniref:G_PROTEIN_RECEP_F1_2 domain-containing protein n=1 Tax=Onchocerca volvulus TaxID=6282 RepID=A0A8R1U183_ONCVO
MAASSHYITILFLIFASNCYEGNTTNIFDIRDEYNTVKKYVAIILFSFFLLYGIVSNALIAIIFCSRNIHYSRAFILITSQLIICSFLNFIPQVTIVLLEMLKTKGSDANKSTWTHSIFATINTFSFFATLHFTFFLAVNRLVAINLPKFSAFFESGKFYILIACVWLSVLVISLTEFHYCIKTFNASNLQWSFNCTKITVESGAIFLKIRYIWTLTLPMAMFAIYIPIFCNMRRKRRNVLVLRKTNGSIALLFVSHGQRNKHAVQNVIRSGKDEWSMLIQAAIICGVMEIEIICFYFLPQFAEKFGDKETKIPINIFINCYVIFNGAVLPTVNLIFIKRFRDELKQKIVELLFKIKNMK